MRGLPVFRAVSCVVRHPAVGRWLIAGLLLGGGALARAHPVVAGYERFYAGLADADVDGGLLLLNELSCVACHQAPAAWQERLPGRPGVSLSTVGSRLSEASLAAFMADPAGFKPGTVMPKLIGSDEAGERAVRALTAYLASLKGEPQAYPTGESRRGRELYHQVGCVACHAPQRGEPAGELPPGTVPSVPLELGAHYALAALVEFLQNPLEIRPAGRMPSIELTEQEAADLAAFLRAGGMGEQPPVDETAGPTAALIDEGRRQFAALGCVACHQTGERLPVQAAPALANLDPAGGCLADMPPPGRPDFALSAAQRRSLIRAVQAVQAAERPPALAPADEVHAHFARLNCYACHSWQNRGGPDAARDRYFTVKTASAESIGEFGRLPPALDLAGRKLTRGWLEQLLAGSGGAVRPYMGVRMPRYGQENAARVIPALEQACRSDRIMEMDTSGRLGHQRSERGRLLLGTGEGGLGCVSCHGLKDRASLGVQLVNLTATAKRLRPEYFKELLLEPQRVQPGTLMPPLFVGRAEADKEVEAIWTYLKELDQGLRLPEGLEITGDYELRPEQAGRPLFFRTFLTGAGTHAIAVGFPEGRHAAFDSLGMRWALIWRGRFLNALSTWEDRRMPPAVPLGEDVRELPPARPLARLGRSDDPWPDSPDGYQFKGYVLSPDGVPTFRYAVDGLAVEDTLRPTPDGAGWRRTLRVSGQGEGWYFRGLVGNEIRPVVWREGVAWFEEEIALGP